jgi:hypothetical protein
MSDWVHMCLREQTFSDKWESTVTPESLSSRVGVYFRASKQLLSLKRLCQAGIRLEVGLICETVFQGQALPAFCDEWAP